jgi:predicted dehydrogenase
VKSESDEVLRVGVAGYGSTGQIRRRHVDSHPRMQTVAVCDRTVTTSGEVSDGVKMWSDWEQLLEEDLDVLFVCLWNDVAPTVVMEGLRRGLHVFCEKPPGRTVEDVIRVRVVEQENPHLKLKYGFNHRYHQSVRDALKIIQNGELGTVVDLRGVYGKSKMVRFDQDWRTKREIAGGGILLDQGIHMVDMMRLFAGEFVDIHAYVSNAFWCHDVEDNAYALMRTADGMVAMLHSSATQWRHRFGLDITLTEGGLSLSGILSSSRSYGTETLTVVSRDDDDRGDPREVTTRYNEDRSWQDEIEEFARAIIANREIRHGSSLEALKTMQLVYEIYAADRDWAERWLQPAESFKGARA